MMLRADYLIDMGPFAGKNGGEIISQGTPKAILAENTLTSKYLSGQWKLRFLPQEEKEKEQA